MPEPAPLFQLAFADIDLHVLERALRLLIATGPLTTRESTSAGWMLTAVTPHEPEA